MTDSPDVDAYTAAEAGRVLKVSPKRVHQFVDEDRLEVVGRSPLRVSQVSVLQLQQERDKAADEQAAGSEGAPRSAGGSRRSPHPHTPSAELVPLLTSAFDRVQAADARTLEEHGLRMTAEAEARFLRDALHEARAAQMRAEQDLAEARTRVAHLDVVEAEVVRLRAELEGVRSESEASDSSEAPSEGRVGGTEGQASDPHDDEVVRLREEVAGMKAARAAEEQREREQWKPLAEAAAQSAQQIEQTLQQVQARQDEFNAQRLEQARAAQTAPTQPSQPQGLISRLFGRR